MIQSPIRHFKLWSMQLLSAWAPMCEHVHTYRHTDMHKHRDVDVRIQMFPVTHTQTPRETCIHTYSHRYMHILVYSDMHAYRHIHAYTYTSYKLSYTCICTYTWKCTQAHTYMCMHLESYMNLFSNTYEPACRIPKLRKERPMGFSRTSQSA